MKGFYTTDCTPQELAKRVDSQQSRLAKLEDENAFLKAKLADTQGEVTDDLCPAGKRSVTVHAGR